MLRAGLRKAAQVGNLSRHAQRAGLDVGLRSGNFVSSCRQKSSGVFPHAPLGLRKAAQRGNLSRHAQRAGTGL